MLQPEAQKRQKRRQEHAIYTVRSSSTASGAAGKFRHLGKGRGGAGTVADADDGDGGGGGERLWSDVSRRFYVVHVAAWNCSCAAFAFAAFPASGATGGAGAGEDRTRTAHEDNRGRVGGASRQSLAGFGGLSATSDSPPPCCKHLLACVLAERWHDVLGDFVAEKTVGPEEAAGWVAGE